MKPKLTSCRPLWNQFIEDGKIRLNIMANMLIKLSPNIINIFEMVIIDKIHQYELVLHSLIHSTFR